ncbi:MAG: reverse transcriptase domain-containing protein [Winogradskyella sp.]
MQIILENLYKAYFEARKNKRYTKEQLKFEQNYEHYLQELYEQIITKNYKVKPCKAFVIEKPVYREVFAPQFVDRVVHHFIVSYINSEVEKKLIEDCYSCRIGKGTLYGIERAKYNMRSVTQNYAKDAYILKLDISGYFMNMSTTLLYQQIKNLKLIKNLECSIAEKDFLNNVLKEVIFTNPIHQCKIVGKTELWQFIPKNKSLFHSAKNCGLPIGNYTSQIFGNIYLNEFDHWVQSDLGIKHYGRYVDDMFFMHQNKDFLKECIPKIQEKIQSYGMEIHPKKIYFQHYTKGLHFLGRCIKPYRTYVSSRTKNNFLQMIKRMEKDLALGLNHLIEEQLLPYYNSCINSYLGFFIKANSYAFIKKVIANLSKAFYTFYYFEKKGTSWKCKLKKTFKNNGIILQPTSI